MQGRPVSQPTIPDPYNLKFMLTEKQTGMYIVTIETEVGRSNQTIEFIKK